MVTFPGFVDFVYLGAPNELQLDNGLGDLISIKNTKYVILNFYHSFIIWFAQVSCLHSFASPCSWSDAVLWNPHLQMEACYKDFVCVENAKVMLTNFLKRDQTHNRLVYALFLTTLSGY